MTKSIIAELWDSPTEKSKEREPLTYNKVYGPPDLWSKSDRLMLVTSLAVSSFLVSAGVLGILAHLGHHVWRFEAIASKINLTYCSLGAVAGGSLFLTTIAIASTKAYLDRKATQNIIKILSEETDATPLHLIAVMGNSQHKSKVYSAGVIRNYHVLYSNEKVFLFATNAALDKKMLYLYKKGYNGLKKNTPDADTVPPESVMDKEISYDKRVAYQKPGWAKTFYDWKLEKATIRERVIKDRFRLGFGITLLALSIAATVVPLFYHFKMSQTLQAFGVSSTTLLLAGALSGSLLRTQSDEFVRKGHDKYYRKVSYGFSYGISRTAFAALFSSLLIAAAYYKFSQLKALNPLLIAPPLAATSIALVAYCFFKGRAHAKRWQEGCKIDKQKEYTAGTVYDLSNTHETRLKDQLWGTRFVLSSHFGRSQRLIIDLADIKDIEKFEGAKLNYNMISTLLPLLALICAISLLGTTLLLHRLPIRPIA